MSDNKFQGENLFAISPTVGHFHKISEKSGEIADKYFPQGCIFILMSFTDGKHKKVVKNFQQMIIRGIKN